MPKVNPDILIWARENAGLSPVEAVQKLEIETAQDIESVDLLKQLESGKIEPTRSILEKMTETYRQPLLLFYLSKPPRPGNRGQDFRTLPAPLTKIEYALINAVIRNIQVRQSLVRSTLEEEDEAEPLSFIGKTRTTEKPASVARQITRALDFDISTYGQFEQTMDALAYLRSRIEASGVFVLFVDNIDNDYSDIPIRGFRGFSLADDVAPFVAINTNDSSGAQVVTMIHELVHLWLGLTGVSGSDTEHHVEKFCNDVATEFLLPEIDFRQLDITENTDIMNATRAIGNTNITDVKRITENTDITDATRIMSEFAQACNVNSSMVAYKLYQDGAFDFAFCSRMAEIFRQNFVERRNRERRLAEKTKGRPSMSVIRRYCAGPALVQLVSRMNATGTLATTKAGMVLGIHATGVRDVLQAPDSGLSTWFA